jgi:hypothetical protein
MDEEDQSDKEEMQSDNAVLEQEATSLLASRSLVVRRGRNNRIYHKFILREIFEESVDEDNDEFNVKKYCGKRKKCKY